MVLFKRYSEKECLESKNEKMYRSLYILIKEEMKKGYKFDEKITNKLSHDWIRHNINDNLLDKKVD